MKYLFSIPIIAMIFLFSCFGIYDPPPNGRYIRIVNQTGKGLYILLDSLPTKPNGKIRWMDTISVNNNTYYSNKLTFVNAFTFKDYFINEKYIKDVSTKDKIRFFFIPDSNINNNISDMKISHFDIEIKDVLKPSEKSNSLNVLFFYPDSLSFTREFSSANY